MSTLPSDGHGDARDAPLIELVQPQPDAAPDPAASSLSGPLVAYLIVVSMAAAACVGYFAREMPWDGWPGFVSLILIAIVFERSGVTIYAKNAYISAGVVALFAIGILYGAPGAAIAAPVVVLAAMAFTNTRWYERFFGVAFYVLANVSSALVFRALVDVEQGLNGWWIPVAVLAAVVNYGVNIPLFTVHMSLQTGEGGLTEWREKSQWLLPYFVVFGLLALALAAGYLALGVPGILAFTAPPLMMRFALHQYVSKTEQTVLELKQKNIELKAANLDITQMAERLTETYNGTLEALVLALDARDRETKGHSLRVAQYALAIARQLGVPESSREWIDIQRGALLHDVGKIGVPDYILHKPGPLTPEEWDEMKRHPHIGHDMLKDISFLAGASAIVQAHHERFDGKGYPRGLVGDQMPLGARIFTVCDAFDAMTSDRPYRKALPMEVARGEIVRHSGTQFDPQVVQAFLFVYSEIAKIAQREHEHERDEQEEHARAA